MSLRAFHLLFIAVSIVLAAFVAAWSVGEYRTGHDAGYIAAAAGSIVSAVGLAWYGAAFQRKTKRLTS
jgi:hypothetical protein